MVCCYSSPRKLLHQVASILTDLLCTPFPPRYQCTASGQGSAHILRQGGVSGWWPVGWTLVTSSPVQHGSSRQVRKYRTLCQGVKGICTPKGMFCREGGAENMVSPSQAAGGTEPFSSHRRPKISLSRRTLLAKAMLLRKKIFWLFSLEQRRN